jgi:hypothetical protein
LQQYEKKMLTKPTVLLYYMHRLRNR